MSGAKPQKANGHVTVYRCGRCGYQAKHIGLNCPCGSGNISSHHVSEEEAKTRCEQAFLYE